VSNTKVVANIQIYLHAKFHIFPRSPIFLLILFSPANLFNWKNDLKWKNRCGPFSLRSAQLYTDPRTSSRASRPASHYRAAVTDRRAHLSALSSPKSPLLCLLTWQRRPNCLRQASHPSPPCATRMVVCVTCQLEPSCRLRCGVASRHRCPPVSALVGAAPVEFQSRPLGDEVLE
jgi:hypothetical protein